MNTTPAIYRLYRCPPDFLKTGGSWLPYDQGLVSLTWCTDARFTMSCHALRMGTPDECEAWNKAHATDISVAKMAGPVVVKQADFYGLMLEGISFTGEKEVWRLSPLRPGVSDNW